MAMWAGTNLLAEQVRRETGAKQWDAGFACLAGPERRVRLRSRNVNIGYEAF